MLRITQTFIEVFLCIRKLHFLIKNSNAFLYSVFYRQCSKYPGLRFEVLADILRSSVDALT